MADKPEPATVKPAAKPSAKTAKPAIKPKKADPAIEVKEAEPADKEKKAKPTMTEFKSSSKYYLSQGGNWNLKDMKSNFKIYQIKNLQTEKDCVFNEKFHYVYIGKADSIAVIKPESSELCRRIGNILQWLVEENKLKKDDFNMTIYNLEQPAESEASVINKFKVCGSDCLNGNKGTETSAPPASIYIIAVLLKSKEIINPYQLKCPIAMTLCTFQSDITYYKLITMHHKVLQVIDGVSWPGKESIDTSQSDPTKSSVIKLFRQLREEKISMKTLLQIGMNSMGKISDSDKLNAATIVDAFKQLSFMQPEVDEEKTE